MPPASPLELPLRDIHLPAPIGWWPPAPGWWLIAVAVGVSLFIVYGYWRRWRNLALHRAARHELRQMQQRYQQNQDALQLVKALSVLLRRVAISVTSRQQAAGLTGQSWLLFLDEIVGSTLFNCGAGRQLLTAPYQTAPADNIETLLSISDQWLALVGKQLKRRRRA